MHTVTSCQLSLRFDEEMITYRHLEEREIVI